LETSSQTSLEKAVQEVLCRLGFFNPALNTGGYNVEYRSVNSQYNGLSGDFAEFLQASVVLYLNRKQFLSEKHLF
jgi:hypothetical protein